MSSHTPEDLRRIMLLLKGKQRAGRDLGKLVAKGHGDMVHGSLRTPEGGSTASRAYSQASFEDPFQRDPILTPELLQMLQLLDSGREAGKKLRARGVGR